jgi:hypothetical protein
VFTASLIDVLTLMKTVLLIVHYHLGSLILMDILDTAETIPKPLTDPLFSRLHAYDTIIRSLNLALNYDKYCPGDSPYGSKLLLDPTPELMVEVLSRSGKAIILSHDNSEILSRTA